MTSNGKKQSPHNSSNPPTLGTVSSLSLGLQGLGLKELITEDDLVAANNGTEDVIMRDDELEGEEAVDFEDISELAEDEGLTGDVRMEEDWSVHSETHAMDEVEGEMTFLSKKSRVRFTDTLSLGALKRTDNLPRTKSVKSHKASLIPLPDQVEAFLSWQMGPFPEKRSNRQRLVLTAEIKRVARVIKTLSALERVKEGIIRELGQLGMPSKSPQLDKQLAKPEEDVATKRRYHAINLVHWEYLLEKGEAPPSPNLTPLFAQMEDEHDARHSVHRIKNQELDSGKWLDAVIVDPRTVSTSALLTFTKLQLPMSDPFLYFDISPPENLHTQLSLAEKLIAEKLRRLRQQQQQQQQSRVPSLSGHVTPTLGAASTSTAILPTNAINYAKCQTDDRFNLSLDKVYDKRRRHLPPVILASSVTTRMASRKNIAGQVLQHSVPAIKMLSPFYKTMPSVMELRCFNRPMLDVGDCAKIKFSALHAEPPSKSAIIKTSKQLTLGDDTPFLLVEYAEDRPLILSNPGMASQLLHYYRKYNPKDTFTPLPSTGMPCKLESTDPSPFLGFGDVPIGQTQPALVNNMTKAPAFMHPTQSTDFVICKQVPKGEDEQIGTPSFHLRSLSSLFLVGQQLPLVEIPAPNSRTLNNIYKGRLQIVAHRSFVKSMGTVGEPLMRILKVYAIFPYISEGSLRKWCKEFADAIRNVTKGDHGTWKRREGLGEWTEEELRSFATPEQCCAAESTLSGQQAVADARYLRQLLQYPSEGTTTTTIQDEAGNTEEDEMSSQAETATQGDSVSRPSTTNFKSNLPEVRLSPWHLSSNFRNALAGKLVLDLTGPADPSHCGAGFSFLRLPQRMVQAQRMFNLGPTTTTSPSSQSGTASPRPPTTTPSLTTQSRVGDPLPSHRHEIARIWQAQLRWLSDTTISPNLHSLLPNRVIPYTGQHIPSLQSQSIPSEVAKRSMVIKGGQIVTEEDEDFSQFLKDKKTPSTAIPPITATIASRTELIIERIYSGEDGMNRIERQVLTDPLIIAAYRRERPIYEKRREARRVTYKDTPIILRRRKQQQQKGDRPETVCTACGLRGHSRTSRTCPRRRGYEGNGMPFLRSGDLPLEQTGLRMGEDGKICITKASLERVDASMRQQMRMVIPLKSIKESGAVVPSPTTISPQRIIREERRARRVGAASSLARILLEIVDELLRHPLVDPFARPVSKKKYPIYYRVIPKPRDLGTIRKKLVIQQQMSASKASKGRPRYGRGSQFMADIELIHTNCLTFNGPEHAFTRTTTELLDTARKMYGERVEGIKELEKIIMGDKYSEGGQNEKESASELEIEGEKEEEHGSFFDSSMQPASQSSLQQRHPMTELERMVMELEGSATTSAPPTEPEEKPRLKLFLRK